MRELFAYYDCNYITTEGISSKWQRIHHNKIEKFLREHRQHNCFTTIQQFKNDVQTDHELQFVPIYFDLDYKDDVEIALVDARSLVQYFSRMEIGQEHIRVYFSGSKGFHIVITPELFNIKPHSELTYIIKNACYYVASHLELKSFDQTVYSIRRMWRMPESVHQKTGLFCTELSHRELNLTLKEIRDIARGVEFTEDKTGEKKIVGRAALWDETEYRHLEAAPICTTWFSGFLQEYENQRDLQNLKPRNPITTYAGENPVCITDLTTNSIRKEGTRNHGEMALMSYYKDTGVDQGTATSLVLEWAKNIPKGLTSKTDKRALEADVKGVAKTVYDKEHGDKYHFACHFIRALGTNTDKPIACAFDKCKFVNQEDQEPENPLNLKLPEATRASYIGKKFSTQVMIAGKDDTPYGIPVRVKVRCKPDMSRDNSVCHNCPLAVFNGEYDYRFTAKDKQILHLLDTTDTNQKIFLRRRFGIPEKCPRHRFEVIEYTNITEILVIPRINFRPDSITEEEPYVARKCFFIGHDIEANKEYEVTAYTYPDVRTQHMIHIIDTVKPLSDDIAQFIPTDEVLQSLKKFQIGPVAKNGNTHA